jgi:hypothetical protein
VCQSLLRCACVVCGVPTTPLYSAVRESSQWSQLVQHQQILVRRGDPHKNLYSLTDHLASHSSARVVWSR